LITVGKWLLVSGSVIAVYLTLRSATGAMTPATAPSYYQFTFAPAQVARNAVQAADRAATVSATAVLLGFLFLWPRDVRLGTARLRIIACAVIWLVGGYGITVFLPVRSSLYCVVPSIGACIAAATLLGAFWSAADAPHRRRALVAGILLPICLVPVYRSRTASVALADFSTQALRDIREETRDAPEGAVLVIVDDRRTRISISTAFGAMINDAVLLTTGRHLGMWIEPPIPGREGVEPPCGSCVYKRLGVVEGRVVAYR
jgi:hypothetical protein